MHRLPDPNINTNPETPAQHFAYWLPGEMIYSAEKAGYDEKIRRARLPLDHPQNMYTFLGNEWHHHRLLMKQGKHYVPHHGKSAQLQVAKLAAGFFDKVAVAAWVCEDTEPTAQNFKDIGRWVGRWAGAYIALSPEQETDVPKKRKNFNAFSDWGDTIEETPLAEGIIEIMKSLRELDDKRGELQQRDWPFTEHNDFARNLALDVTDYYLAYANWHLAPSQYELPISELAPPDRIAH